MTSTLHNTTMNRRNSNDSESRINPNDPVSYTTQYAPHNASLATAEAGLPQASQTQEPAQSTTDTNSGGIFSNATETAKQYIPTSTTITNNSNPGMLANATETVKQYMPESVAGVLKNVGVMERDTSVTDATSLPSQENKFAPSRGGVGTLPGTLSETSVAKLPQEKEAENKVGHELGREGVLGTEAEERPVGLMDIIAESKRTDVDSGIDTVSKFINLDVLPTPQGTPGEGTTLKHAVPDNRPAELKTEPSPLNNGPERMQSEPSKEMEKAVNKPLPPAGGNTNDFKHTPHESKKADDPKNTGSVLDEGRSASDTTYTQDQAKRKAPRTEPSNVNEATSSPPKPTQQGVERKEEVKHEETKGNESNDKSGKVSLTQKLKGEVKVISGKLSNNPAKVEEGQALKKGNTA